MNLKNNNNGGKKLKMKEKSSRKRRKTGSIIADVLLIALYDSFPRFCDDGSVLALSMTKIKNRKSLLNEERMRKNSKIPRSEFREVMRQTVAWHHRHLFGRRNAKAANTFAFSANDAQQAEA